MSEPRLARESKPRVLPFLVARFVRIAPPYYVALATFAFLGLTPFGYPTALDGASLSPETSSHELVADLLFAGSFAPIHNTSFWTLGIEMRWYVLCAPLVLVWRKSRPAFAAIALSLYALYWWSPFGIVDEGTLSAFMLGIVAASVDRDFANALATRTALAAASVALIAIAIGLQWHSLVVDHMSPTWHVAVAFLVVCGRLPPSSRVFSWRPLVAVGSASYSIYLVHQPIIDALENCHVAPIFAALGGIAAGFAFWRIVEVPLARPSRRQRLVDRTLRTTRFIVDAERPSARLTGAGRADESGDTRPAR